MLQPGSKNWIKKYFSLEEEGKIDLSKNNPPDNMDKPQYLHDVFFRSGIVFGYPIEPLFFGDLEVTSKWTLSESTSFLLFESLILVYKTQNGTFNKTDFIASVLDFYKQYNEKSKVNIFSWLFRETDEIKLEHIIQSRVVAKKTLLNQLWVNYMHNSLVYLDVMAYRLFLLRDKKIHQSYDVFLQGSLSTIAAMSINDEKVDERLLSTYLSSAALTKEDKIAFRKRLNDGSIQIKDIHIPDKIDDLYKFYLLDIAVLTVHTDLSEMSEELELLKELAQHLQIDLKSLKNSIAIIERFIMRNNDKITFLSSSSYEKMSHNFSRHWIRVLGRSKDKFVLELKENKELITLVNQSLSRDLTEEEKEKVKAQFSDLAKTLPSVAIFMLPGGSLLLPIILKIIPDLVPSAFKNN